MRHFNVDEYYCMGEAGILHPAERLELVEGVIVAMSPIGGRHAQRVSELHEWFVLHLPNTAAVRSQNPVRLSAHLEPQPDIAIVHRRAEGYAPGHPGPEDVLLIIEVSDTTLAYDRDEKLLLYAAAGIPDAWIADLGGDQVFVCREPRDGRYTSITVARRGERITPLAFPDLSIEVDEILG